VVEYLKGVRPRRLFLRHAVATMAILQILSCDATDAACHFLFTSAGRFATCFTKDARAPRIADAAGRAAGRVQVFRRPPAGLRRVEVMLGGNSQINRHVLSSNCAGARFTDIGVVKNKISIARLRLGMRTDR
jgi:hypothetical protein